MKHLISLAFVAWAFGYAQASPTVSSVRVEASTNSPLVTVAYKLDADAVVTVRFLLGDQLVPFSRNAWVGGDVNALVSATGAQEERFIYWSPDKEDWGTDGLPVLANLKAIVTAWDPEAPPDYLVADLVLTNCVRYYVSAEAVPLGVTNDVYKTSKMVFRKIPAQDVVWMMGLGSADTGSGGYRGYRKNKLTADFYIGIYPVTQNQNYRITGSKGGGNASWLNSEDSPRRTTCGNTISAILGAEDVLEPTASSYIGKFRAFTGLTRITLPTEAQWEYACRAGSGDPAYWGSDISGSSHKYAWTSNCFSGNDDPNKHPQVVGLLLENKYGLYDMLGNVWEYCLDFCTTLDADTENTAVDFVQTTPPATYNRVTKGGSYANDIWFARTSYYVGGKGDGWNFGYRLAIPLTAR